jgi:hypothetical protein
MELHSILSIAVALFHAITISSKSLQWGNNQYKAFDAPKKKISQAPIISLPNLHKPFEVETICYYS